MKKTIKIVIGFMLLSLGVYSYSDQVYAAKPVRMNRSKAALKEGKTLKLSLKNAKKTKIKWSSSNKKVVSVNKSGKIKALRVGKAKIIAKYKSKKYVCQVEVISNKKTTAVTASPVPVSNPTQPTQMPDVTNKPDDVKVSVLKGLYISDVIANSYDWFLMIDYVDGSNNQKFSNSYQSLQNADITLNGNKVAVSELKKGDLLEIGYVGNIAEDRFATIPNVKYIKATR